MEHYFCKFIPQVIHHTGLSLKILLGLNGKVFGHHGTSHLESWICPGLVIPGSEELQIIMFNLSPVPLDYEIVHCAGAVHKNADCLSQLPTIALVSSIADELYDKLLVDQSLWGEEPTKIQNVLKKLSVDIKVKDGQLFKLYKDNWLPYVRPSIRKTL
ncbi:hypothetical protein DSO57_1018276 [Entomophthora muscae]|uniref:Uncharacterized protein n=1 Tax=Entomophthora muscae TaxID=34485 RepID=A0ACC2ST31_9FUNG|nr:hypothetical protein DSO57_1018276 [Entomophthora muscae]